MAKDPIKKADNGTYYFRANLGYNPITENRYRNTEVDSERKRSKGRIFKTGVSFYRRINNKKDGVSFQQFIEETYLPWYKHR